MGIEHFFHGYALNAVDAKGRVSIPADFRAAIERRAQAGHVIAGPHASADCLVAYDRSYSAQLSDNVRARSGPPTDAWNQRSVVSFGTTEELPYDSTGRIMLTKTLRLWAGIESLALFLGDGETFQIWNPRTLLAMDGLDRRLDRFVRALMAEKGETP